ncbi:hypothetical protein [Marilutibacter maris]|uniref:hypothetical protein n=1 Tax=Marilutibacter maris TaxID=1605891 RepID=UPI0011AE89A8|nr:hypothetical protein [Lysobacter maris]
MTTESALSIEELASLPAYVGYTSSPDCIYDGSLVELSHRMPLLADGGELVLEILGPYWDRVFRLAFFGVSAVELRGFGPALGMDVRELSLTDHANFKRCEILGLSFPVVIAVNYSHATVTRRLLESPVKCSEPGT